jgi:osmotically-inducible protein OsmY
VRGVRAVANEIQVELPATDQRTDEEIARAAAQALAGDTLLGPRHLQVTVAGGWITVRGEVEWNYQRAEAEHLLRRLWGVRGVSSQIEVETRPSPPELERRIREALLRIAKVDAEHVQVDVDGGTAILMGAVRSWAEREEIERTAWQAPGITRVEDRIQIVPV